jgi:hypothetical protein
MYDHAYTMLDKEKSMKKKIVAALIMGAALMGVLSVVAGQAVTTDSSSLSIERCLTLLREGQALNLHTLGVCQEPISKGRLVFDATCGGWLIEY